MNDERTQFSRFQVRCEGRPAWAVDTRDRRYYFDGFRFWTIGARSSRMTTAWRAPGHGWVHEEDCRCSLCEAPRYEGVPQAA